MERLFKLKMEVVLIRDGHFSLTDLPDLPAEDVVDYFNLIQRDKEAQAEQEEAWYNSQTRR